MMGVGRKAGEGKEAGRKGKLEAARRPSHISLSFHLPSIERIKTHNVI